nr:wall-associated receptor kinase-like 20 [Quercus suber]
MEAMEATHKLFIFTLEALLLILTSSAHQQQQCSDCGNTSVPYPLSTAPTCGDKSYKIRCDAGRLLFDTVNNTYPITSVNPTNQRLVMPATLSSNDTCVTSDIVYEGIQLNSSLPFNITSSNTILYLNCTETLLQSPLNCTSASLCHVYANQTDSVAPCRYAGLCCTFRTGGSSTEHRIRTIPRLLEAPSLENLHAKIVSCGARHSALITEDAKVFCWGWNKYGQLGLGDVIDRNIPSQVIIDGGVPRNVACGWWHTLLLAESPT